MTKAFLLEHNQPGLARRLQDFVGSLPALVSTLLWGAVALALTMAVVSAINYVPERWSGPPDEYLHRAAARYYIDHWLPPRVGEPATLDS